MLAPIKGVKLTAQGIVRAGDDIVAVASRTARRTIDFSDEALELGGKAYGAEKLGTLQKYLAKRGVKLEVDSADLPWGKAGAFIADESGAARLLVKSGVTHDVMWHELSHFRQWKQLGPEKFMALPRVTGNHVPEQFVFDMLNTPTRWTRLSPEYRVHMVKGIEKLGGTGR